jgi:colanic acid biosynthesis protein WcaH
MNFIPLPDYKNIIKSVPILCVDVIAQNSVGEYLLLKRANEPLKNIWWVIGGRVHKGELMIQAAIRKVKEETSLNIKNLNLMGYYEEIFDKNSFNINSKLHTVSIVYSTVINSDQKIKLDSQSTDWKYSKELPPGFDVKLFSNIE